MSSIKEIIHQCLLEGISVELVLCPSAVDGFAYVVEGFAKSGNAKVYEGLDGENHVLLRYDTHETIESFEDLACICKQWCMDYKDRGYGVGSWEQAFKNLGWLSDRVKTETILEWNK